MKVNREMLEDQAERYEAQLRSLRSFIKELNDRVAEYGTDRAQFEEDLLEAEHNIKFYEGEIARVKQEMGESDKAPRASDPADSILPRTAKQGIGSLILSLISFAAGTLLGSRMKTRQASKEEQREKERKEFEK